MTFPPAWKIWREVRRFKTKIPRELHRGGSKTVGMLRRMSYEPLTQFLHDSVLSRPQVLSEGRLPLTTRVAVLVLFQPHGLANSIRVTLDYLAAENWSILVVSNAPLAAADAAMVRERAALLLERPNIGYDFGGYRAGLRLIAELGHKPERLILMNDSTWFPLRDGDATLRRMESLDAAMTGHVFKTEERKGSHHLESHLIMLGPEAIGHQGRCQQIVLVRTLF